MRTSITSLVLMLVTVGVQAQSQFSVYLTGANEVPPNGSVNWGSGSFALNGQLLSWSIGCPDLSFVPTGGSVYGPASTDENAMALFSLGTPFTGPGPQAGVVTFYAGSRSVDAAEIEQLAGGRWYVDILSPEYPAGEIRGQISLVPEPSAALLLPLGLCVFAVVRRYGGARRKVLGCGLGTLLLGVTLCRASEPGLGPLLVTTGPVIVTPDGGGVSEPGSVVSVAPWVDVPATMPYLDALPVVVEQPRLTLPAVEFGLGSGVSTVPEPSTVCLCLLGAGALLVRRVWERKR